jgi:DMSO/TMAO reductase YedYZ molybdopterin-dependent catalytic subunit
LKLPPGQSFTQKFPIVGEKEPPEEALEIAGWRLEIGGLVSTSVSLDYDQVIALAQDEFTADIHCVTSWSQPGMRFTGIKLSSFLAQLNLTPQSAARFIRFEAYSHRHHDTSLPLHVAMEDSWLVHSFEGEPLTRSRGYPLRVVTPSRYFYKSLKWLRRMTFLDTDQLGFWERTSGYHNNADPWKEQRLEGSRFTSKEEADAFRALTDFHQWREMDPVHEPKVIVKADFKNWQPLTRNLCGLHLKACQFQGAHLDGVDFTGANLTLGQFTGASLSGAVFDATDLEGADFSGADLTGARFSRNFLSATTFRREEKPLLAFAGMTMVAPDGLLEDQRSYLEELGVLATSPS